MSENYCTVAVMGLVDWYKMQVKRSACKGSHRYSARKR
jgi:hypothetical protein